MNVDRLLTGVLIASVLLNVYLFVRKRPQQESEQQPTVAAEHERAPIPEHPSSPADGPKEHEQLGRHEREQRVLEVEEQVERLRPAHERFEHRLPAPENEAIVRTYLDDVFEVPAGAKANYSLECRGTVCKWSSPLPDAVARVQTLRVDGLFKRRTFGRFGNFIELNDDFDRPVTTLLANLIVTFHRSPGFKMCLASLPAEEFVVITWTLTFQPTDRRLVAAASLRTPSVENEPSDVCRSALQSVADATLIPADIVSMPDWEFTFLVDRSVEDAP